MLMLVLPARTVDVGDYAAHLARHLAQSGRQGLPHFGVMRAIDREQVEAYMDARWRIDVRAVDWGRAWLLWDRDPSGPRGRTSFTDFPRVVGHAELRGPNVETALHRALFSIGLEREQVGKGHGRVMMETALAWAHLERSLEWVDLRVFSGNGPARALYQSLGFAEIGTCRDAFRMDDGTHIDDIHMVFDLVAARARKAHGGHAAE
jgi:RimJ/RimL family protein N-acetyltransferase